MREFNKGKGYKHYRKFDLVVFDDSTSDSNSTSRKRPLTTTGINTYTGQWTDNEITHLLRRTMFGFKKSELIEFRGMTMDQGVDKLLTPIPIPAPPINTYFDFVGEVEGEPADVAPGATWVNAPHKGSVTYFRNLTLKGWWMNLMMSTEGSALPKMGFFWQNLLPTQFFGGEIPVMSYDYSEMLLTNSFGNYKTMIKDLTLNNAMLIFLNGYLNSKYAPDENYGRELQELFTVGKGPDSNYTENDVYEAARILTGWNIDWEQLIDFGNPTTVFHTDNHDTGDKTFSSFYGNKTITGKSGIEGQAETDELIDMLFENEELAKYICRRIYNYYVYHEIDSNAEENVIVPLAQIFRDSNYEILPVLETLFKSEHFYDVANQGAYIKSPADHTIGLIKSLGYNEPEDLPQNFQFWETVYWTMAGMGLEIGDPPSVAGWQAFYQQPNFDKIWMNTDTVTKRASFQDYLIYNSSDLISYVQTFSNPEDPSLLVQEVAKLQLGIEVDQHVLAELKLSLLGGQQDDFYWTFAWNDYQSNSENEEFALIVKSRLQSLFQSMFQLSEFQLF